MYYIMIMPNRSTIIKNAAKTIILCLNDYNEYANIGEPLARFFEIVLPKISNNWWKNIVVNKLTDEQRDRVQNENITNLRELDIRALFRVFEQNVNDISRQCKFYKKDKNLIFDMTAVCNHWAHKPIKGYNVDEIYRDLDTMQLFLKLINAEKKDIHELKEIRDDVSTIIKENDNSSRPKKTSKAKEKDLSQYIFNGEVYGKSRLVLAVIKEYIDRNNKNLTLEKLQEIFDKKIQGSSGIIEESNNANRIYKTTGHKRHFIDDVIKLNNGQNIVVCTQWKKDNIVKFINKAQELGFVIETKI